MALGSISAYRRITQDTAADDASVTAALADAQGLLEESLRRRGVLETGTRTEVCRVYNMQQSLLFIGGLCYPQATPITAVSSPAGVTFTDSEIRGVSGTVFDLVTDMVNEYPEVTVTYVGGWTAATLPGTLMRALCLVARECLAVPASASGALSVRLGDAGVSYRHDQTPSTAIDAILNAPGIQRWRRRRPVR